ncbi:hypothetical protein ACQV5M_22180, partial [Leptospira sp. SA-E8]|uniref:hypothetical protein n=1 Tax=Leptospira sp. SA-E8 TaxID=3422259 RepID=UPI003EC0A4B2
TLALLSPEALGELTVRPHPAARWVWHPEQPIYAIWRANREEMALDDALPWIGDGALLTRPGGAVRWCAAGPGQCAFLDACDDRQTLAVAAQAAQQVQPETDIARLLADLISAGALLASDATLPNT